MKDERGRSEPGIRKMCLRTFEPVSARYDAAYRARLTVALRATASGPSLSLLPGQNTGACNENGASWLPLLLY
jgi:hypothetical protein